MMGVGLTVSSFGRLAMPSGKIAKVNPTSLFYVMMKPIGILIKEELLAQERSVAWFARKIHLDRSNVYRLFQKNSVDTDLLRRISQVLGRDFFAVYSESISADAGRKDLR